MWKRYFIEFLLRCGALKFSTFELKSRRISPYFLNTGKCFKGSTMESLSYYYARALFESGAEFDTLFGPAYKGTLLVPPVALTLYTQFAIDVSFGSNRKEPKEYAEGGTTVGAEPVGNVAVIDDVITVGETKAEAFDHIKRCGGTPVLLIIAFDRQERVGPPGTPSAVQHVEQMGVPVVPIVTASEMLHVLESHDTYEEQVFQVKKYLKRYGVGT